MLIEICDVCDNTKFRMISNGMVKCTMCGANYIYNWDTEKWETSDDDNIKDTINFLFETFNN